MNLDFDTGSADLWVYSTLQSSSEQSGHTVYNPKDGTSTLKSGYTWDIEYGDGSSASGDVYADKVVVGGVTATSQAVEAATSVSSEFLDDTASDGLLGLAFSTINTVEPTAQTTFFDTVSSTLAKKLFTADLKKGAAGAYDFGYIDSTKYTGSITYVNVDSSQGFWQFTAGAYAIGSGATSTSTVGTAIADTGTTLLYLPSALVTAYYKQVSGATNSATYGGYIVPCSATLPSLTLVIGGTKFVVVSRRSRHVSHAAGANYLPSLAATSTIPRSPAPSALVVSSQTLALAFPSLETSSSSRSLSSLTRPPALLVLASPSNRGHVVMTGATGQLFAWRLSTDRGLTKAARSSRIPLAHSLNGHDRFTFSYCSYSSETTFSMQHSHQS